MILGPALRRVLSTGSPFTEEAFVSLPATGRAVRLEAEYAGAEVVSLCIYLA